jgi:hypothetical protein
MKGWLTQILRSRWLAVATHLGLWLLLYLSLLALAGSSSSLREAEGSTLAARSPVPVAGLEDLFAPGTWPRPAADTNSLDPFYTKHFIPPTAPPATTRKIEVVYQGFYQTDNGPKQALVRLGGVFVSCPIGGTIATNVFVAELTFQTMTLTNRSAQTNVVPLNATKEIEVPIP